MSYYRRRSYPRRRKRRSRSFAQRASASSSPYHKSLAFVRSEFFRFEVFTFERFTDFYGRKYGKGARQYLRRTYDRWRSGRTKMVVQTERRILECVPPFLDESKQFQLLSFYIPSVIHQQKGELNSHGMRTSQMDKTYRAVAKAIVEKEYRLDWFVKEAFPAAELEQFLNVFKYTMLDCLRHSYAQVRQDLSMVQNYIPKIDGSVDMSYHIALLDCPLEVDVLPPPGEMRLPINMPAPPLVTQFKDQYREILLQHALDQCKIEKMEQGNRQVAFSDLHALPSQLQRTKSDQEYDSTIQVRGHGGTLRVRLQKKNLLRLRYAITMQTIKLLFVLCVSGAAATWVCLNGLWPILFFPGIFLLSIIGTVWSRLQELISEVNEYERKRASRLAAS